MKVLLIGGTGFIGPHVVAALLRDGHQAVVFHRGSSKAPDGATSLIGDRRRLREHAAQIHALEPDVVVDLILSSGTRARDLMAVLRGVTGRVVALSSCDVYRACGITHGLEEGPLEPLPLTESSALRTRLQTYPPAQVRMLQQVFGWLDEQYDKIPVEREILGDSQLPGTVLRLPMVYGPGDPLHRFQPVVKRALDGRDAILMSADMAGWRATRGYVEDVGAAIARAAVSTQAAGRIYNVGEPDALTELEWARGAASALQWHGEFRLMADDALPPFLRAPGNTAQHWVTDTGRIRRELGFEEAVSREVAIRRTVAWESAHVAAPFAAHQFDYAAEDTALAGRTPDG